MANSPVYLTLSPDALLIRKLRQDGLVSPLQCFQETRISNLVVKMVFGHRLYNTEIVARPS